jgi:hypothetical protein
LSRAKDRSVAEDEGFAVQENVEVLVPAADMRCPVHALQQPHQQVESERGEHDARGQLAARQRQHHRDGTQGAQDRTEQVSQHGLAGSIRDVLASYS